MQTLKPSPSTLYVTFYTVPSRSAIRLHSTLHYTISFYTATLFVTSSLSLLFRTDRFSSFSFVQMACNISREGCQLELTIRLRLCSTNSRDEDYRYHVHAESQHRSAERQPNAAQNPGQFVSRRNFGLGAHSHSHPVRAASSRNLSEQARPRLYNSSALTTTAQDRENLLSQSRRLSEKFHNSLDDILLPEIRAMLQQNNNRGVVSASNAPSGSLETLPQRETSTQRNRIMNYSPRAPTYAVTIAPPKRRFRVELLLPPAPRRPRRPRPVISTSTSASRIPVFRPYQPQVSRNRSVFEALNRKVTQTLTSNDMTRGFIYVFWEPQTSDYVKIGYTRNIYARLGQWRNECRRNYTFHPATSTVRGAVIPHAQRVEQLIHTELKDHRKMIQCCSGCGRVHDEWFDVSGEHVAKVFRKWRDWIEQEPYAFDPDWNL